jgi:hypothetical protein
MGLFLRFSAPPTLGGLLGPAGNIILIIVVAVGGYHQHRQRWVAPFDLAQQLQPARPGM